MDGWFAIAMFDYWRDLGGIGLLDDRRLSVESKVVCGESKSQ